MQSFNNSRIFLYLPAPPALLAHCHCPAHRLVRMEAQPASAPAAEKEGFPPTKEQPVGRFPPPSDGYPVQASPAFLWLFNDNPVRPSTDACSLLALDSYVIASAFWALHNFPPNMIGLLNQKMK